ncbi:hypothetical protein K3495_g10195 [Podosphaera aphanis]|nr:hypothetical protein K3495_g10195 [Podosphaera aphanis]
MLSMFTTKIALRKAGLPTSLPALPDTSSLSSSKDPNAPSPFASFVPYVQVPNSLKSWQNPVPAPIEIAGPPILGDRAPTCQKLSLPLLNGSRKPCIVVFLRHCGCPFAEKTFIKLRTLANKYPNLACIAVSHCSKPATDKWVTLLGGAWAVQVIIDEEREVYAQWGLGISSTYHLLNPWTQMAARRLGNEEGIWGRDVDPSGNRWVIGGAWCMNELGSIKWGGANQTADDMPKLDEATQKLGLS